MVASNLKKITSHYPHVVISNLAREKMDPNRPIDKATFGYEWATLAYKEYHKFIKLAKGS